MDVYEIIAIVMLETNRLFNKIMYFFQIMLYLFVYHYFDIDIGSL